MNYRKVYLEIIFSAKNQVKLGLRPKTKYYQQKDFSTQTFEFHHILPKSLFPLWKNKESNIVPLTPREHFFCHQLLLKIYNCKEMQVALFMMSHRMGKKISSRLYEDFKKVIKTFNVRSLSKEAIENQKKAWEIFKKSKAFKNYINKKSKQAKKMWEGKTNSQKEEIFKKISESNKGKIVTKEAIQKGINTKKKNGTYGKTVWKGRHHTEAAKRKNSEWHKLHPNSKEIMNRIHEKCKGKKRTIEQKKRQSEAALKRDNSKNIKRMKHVHDLYQKYKNQGGTIIWNIFQKYYKEYERNGYITGDKR